MAMLSIVLGLLVVVLYFIKRLIVFKRGAKGDLFIKVLSSLHLSPKERIEVIEVSGERIVLGITPGNISFLTKISPIHGDAGGENRGRENHDVVEK